MNVSSGERIRWMIDQLTTSILPPTNSVLWAMTFSHLPTLMHCSRMEESTLQKLATHQLEKDRLLWTLWQFYQKIWLTGWLMASGTQRHATSHMPFPDFQAAMFAIPNWVQYNILWTRGKCIRHWDLCAIQQA